MQARIGELEASLATGTSALRQLSTQQAGHSAPKPPKPPQPEKFQGDRRSGAASNWLHQMTLYLTILGLLVLPKGPKLWLRDYMVAVVVGPEACSR